MAETISLLAEGGSLEGFFGVFNFLFENLNDLLSNPAIQEILGTVAKYVGMAKALSPAAMGLSAAGKIFLGYGLKFVGLIGPLVAKIGGAMAARGVGGRLATTAASTGRRAAGAAKAAGLTADGRAIVGAIRGLCACLSGGGAAARTSTVQRVAAGTGASGVGVAAGAIGPAVALPGAADATKKGGF